MTNARASPFEQSLRIIELNAAREEQAHPARIKCNREYDACAFCICGETRRQRVVIVIDQDIGLGVPVAKESDSCIALSGNLRQIAGREAGELLFRLVALMRAAA